MNAIDSETVVDTLVDLENYVREARPNDRSEEDRACAIFITDLQKLRAYFIVYIAKSAE